MLLNLTRVETNYLTLLISEGVEMTKWVESERSKQWKYLRYWHDEFIDFPVKNPFQATNNELGLLQRFCNKITII